MDELPTIDPSLRAREGTIDFRGYRIWYGCVGEEEEVAGKLPLLCLHGGPGAGHDYLESLGAMAKRGRGAASAQLLALDDARRAAITEAQTVQAQANAQAKAIGAAMAKKDMALAESLKGEVGAMKARRVAQAERADQAARAAGGCRGRSLPQQRAASARHRARDRTLRRA